MENMTEIAGTGFFFARLPDGSFSFSQGMGDGAQELDPPSFAQAFGATVDSQEARQQAANLLNEVNKRMNLSLSLAPFGEQGDGPTGEATQEMNAQMGSFLGG